ncbi:MAG: CoA-binding protein, partial [Promethearchaeota archaeon]
MSTIESPQNINFDKLFFPKSIGIIGVSRDPGSGGFFLRCMRNRFKGPIYLFNPRLSGQELYGYKIYSSILEINEPIDYAILAVPARLCPQLMEEVGQKGVPFATVFASGFREVGNES